MKGRELKILIDLERLRYFNSGIANVFRNLAIGLSEIKEVEQKGIFLFGPLEPVNSLKTRFSVVKRRSSYKIIPLHTFRYNIIHTSHQLSSYFHYKSPRQKKVVTLHDLNFLHENISEKKGKKELKKVKRNIENADVIVCISEFTKNDLIENKHLFSFCKEPQIKVIYNGVRFPESKKIYDLGKYTYLKNKKYILNIGVLFPKKNQLSLIRMLPFIDEDLVLVVSDQNACYMKKIQSEIDFLGMSHRVHFCENISEEVKCGLIQNCTSLCQPSKAEGFGIPIIEAMSFGKPVFLSKLTSLPEVGGDVAFYFNNFKTKHMVDVYKKGMQDYEETKEAFSQSLISRAKKFDYKTMAYQYYEVYKSLLV
ncbi:glycosyltransferase family 1 protein [Wenyingzhuangia sp. 2_MG-2023]|uniref:glycosyltransferase family 4 protein n=1 Tax=Wenyingzhuangia sp. 2_MG-2023 TaxID=3062639 RepID=UPI0026E416A3|nr:glycosyltransferase family 1 protein [Wenyingzhuangia sp. 2_MG-2023]MDO6738428.1 glycosyltransferase family 1 protein [Wenyingzhuangia sp. 2_MG-2023]